MIYSTRFWEMYFFAGAVLFILPTVIGMVRQVDRLSLVIWLNVLALVSFGTGWIGAMLFAFGPKRRPRGMPY